MLIFLKRLSKEKAVASLEAFHVDSPVHTPHGNRTLSCIDEPWTPGVQSQPFCENSSRKKVEVFNSSMAQLADAINKPRIQLLNSQVGCWNRCTNSEQEIYLRTTEEACRLICSAIAPNDSDHIFETFQQKRYSSYDNNVGLQALVAAYKSAPSKPLKTQILSIYASKYSAKELKAIHEPFERLSDRQIKKARQHSTAQGPGTPAIKKVQHRVRIDKAKLDHFLEFTFRPYFYQDVAYGNRTIKLDNGEELSMPNIVRTVARSTIIHQYLDFCKETEFEPMSQSTMWRVVEVQEATQRKSLQGLDNTAADGADGFEELMKIIDDLEEAGASVAWCSQTRKKLCAGKLYLKTTYRNHCQEDNSQCPDHCIPFALSDPDDKNLRVDCCHEHNLVCTDCHSLADTLQAVKSEIPNHLSRLGKEKKEDLEYDANAASKKIFDWKAHIIRAQNQERSKHTVLESLEEEEILIVVDWAMKFTAIKFREKQSEWYAKRGMSWHISSVIFKDGQILKVTSYAHLFNNCRQDWYAVLSVLEDLLSIIKGNNAGITKAYIRSDEAGCYHNSQLIASLQQLGERHSIKIVRYDHSEPQFGKDICDRILCPMKAAIRRFCNEGHDITSAEDMYGALKERPVGGTTTAVCAIQEQNLSLQIRKIPNYSSYHSFEFTATGLRVWKAYNVGPGKLIKWNTIVSVSQGATLMKVDVPFFPVKPREIKQRNKAADHEEEDVGKYECPDPQCKEEFENRGDLDLHLALIEHRVPAHQAKESLYDNIRRDWVYRFQTLSLTSQPKPLSFEKGEENPSKSKYPKAMGWALHKNRGKTRFPPIVRSYLMKKFLIGEKTGRKEDPAQVAKDMRTACTTEGVRMFKRTEWLSKTQIQGFFSRTAAKVKKGNLPDIEENYLDVGGEQDDDEDSDEEYAQLADEEQMRATSEAVIADIDIAHPVMYDVFDLCKMTDEKKLTSFTVKMLREVCNYFEIPFKSRDTKGVLVDKVTEMVSSCSCH